MKKDNRAQTGVVVEKCEHAVAGHEHLHATNCGHKSYVHAGHICYEHDGHFHYMHDGHAHECAGPKAQPTVNRSTNMPKQNATTAPVIPLSSAKNKKNKK